LRWRDFVRFKGHKNDGKIRRNKQMFFNYYIKRMKMKMKMNENDVRVGLFLFGEFLFSS
jgi:hypothetical protein